MSVIAKIVQRKRRPRIKHTPAELEALAAAMKAKAKPGDCPKCGGPALMIGKVYSEDLPRKCRLCAHEFTMEKVSG